MQDPLKKLQSNVQSEEGQHYVQQHQTVYSEQSMQLKEKQRKERGKR